MEVHEARSFSADQEFQRIRSIIYQKENNLARLDAEIARLSEERTIESQSLRAHQILMAPVRRLPLELLSQIFVHCLDGHEFVSPDTTQAPILLTHVCSAWRKAAIFTPKLWCSINLKLLPLKQRSKPHIARLMETWLARSGRRPLSISLELHSNEAVASDMLKVLFCYMDRWQHVKLDLVMSNTPILSLLKQNFSPPHSSPLLETFNLRTEGGLGSRGEEHLTIMMHSAQRLRRFSWIDEEYSINVDPFNATPSYLTLPWSQLREINLHCQLSLWHCIGILHLSPGLESCTFNSVQLESQQPPLPFQIILPKLKRLSVSSAFSLSSLFDQLTLPALRELEMHFNYDGNNMIPAWSQAQFMRLLIRSSCHLESLLMRAPISEDELIACLERIGSSLVHLTVNGQLSRAPCVTNRILTLLTPRVLQDGQIVCLSPRLQRITLCRCMKFNHSISPGVLADMIESRWREPDASDSPPIISKLGGAFVSRAEYIELTLSASAISMDDVSRLETMRKEGLDLRFSYTS